GRGGPQQRARHPRRPAGDPGADRRRGRALEPWMTERQSSLADALSKVPQVTLAFWAIKILATTLGETGGDALSMQLNLGYLVSTLIFLGFFLVTVSAQISADRFRPLFYWACVVATTTVGTTTSDY